MRLLTAGIDSTVIALWLGYKSIETEPSILTQVQHGVRAMSAARVCARTVLRNEAEIVDLVRAPTGRGSFSNTHGPLHFYGEGPDVEVDNGDWVVRVAGKPLVMSEEEFFTHFSAV